MDPIWKGFVPARVSLGRDLNAVGPNQRDARIL